MSDDPEATLVLREWVAKAEGDFAAASKLLEIEGPTWIVCFHAQQAGEKYLKAMLVQLQSPFGKTHDIGELSRLLPESKRPSLDAAEAFELTRPRGRGPISRSAGADAAGSKARVGSGIEGSGVRAPSASRRCSRSPVTAFENGVRKL